MPKVTSAVIVLEPRPPSASKSDLQRALALAARALTRPRKMLSNAAGKALTNEEIEAAGLDPNARPGTITLDSWLRLAAVQAQDPV